MAHHIIHYVTKMWEISQDTDLKWSIVVHQMTNSLEVGLHGPFTEHVLQAKLLQTRVLY